MTRRLCRPFSCAESTAICTSLKCLFSLRLIFKLSDPRLMRPRALFRFVSKPFSITNLATRTSKLLAISLRTTYQLIHDRHDFAMFVLKHVLRSNSRDDLQVLISALVASIIFSPSHSGLPTPSCSIRILCSPKRYRSHRFHESLHSSPSADSIKFKPLTESIRISNFLASTTLTIRFT